MNELKSCPFCGMPATVKQDTTGSWYLECSLCGVFKGYYKTKRFAIDAWNTRNGKKSGVNAEWVSVNDKLPENDYGKHWKDRKMYLVRIEPSGLMRVARYGYKKFDWWVDSHDCVLSKESYTGVTHWMPLPEPPITNKDSD